MKHGRAGRRTSHRPTARVAGLAIPALGGRQRGAAGGRTPMRDSLAEAAGALRAGWHIPMAPVRDCWLRPDDV